MLARFVQKLPLSENARRLAVFQVQTPLLAIINPRVVESSDKKVEIVVPLNWVTKNSWNTMFFAAIASGCDLTGGWGLTRQGIGFLYKGMEIDFLRRVDGDLHLVCSDIEAIRAAELEAENSSDRINVPVEVVGYCYHYSKEKPVVRSRMTLSLKKKQ
jgi:hypothetical protein